MTFKNEIEKQILTPQFWPTHVYCHVEDWRFWRTPKSIYMVKRLLYGVSRKKKHITKRLLDRFIK